MRSTKGYTFTTGLAGDASATDLHTLVDSATFSSMTLDDFSSTDHPIYKSGTAPSAPITGQLWWKLNCGGTAAEAAGYGVHQLLCWTGAIWTPIATGATMTNKDVSSATYGVPAFVGTTTDNSFLLTVAGAARNTLIGVVGETVAVGSSGIIITNGLIVNNITAGGAGASMKPGFWISPNTPSTSFGSTLGATVGSYACGRIIRLDTVNSINWCAWYFSGIAKIT